MSPLFQAIDTQHIPKSLRFYEYISLGGEITGIVKDGINHQLVGFGIDIAPLVADLDSLRVERDRRVLELESFRASYGSLEACLNQRNDLAELGVEGERLLQEARQYLKATVQQ